MMRRCSHCSNNGHNSRTCPHREVKILGVRPTDGSIRKCASMGNLAQYSGSTGGASPADETDRGGPAAADGYASEELVQCNASSCCERKRGVSWTEKEHRMFLIGLQKLGKGDWRGIARDYVQTRTPTQVASHAQKYFMRHINASRRKRRTSLFDIVPNEPLDAQLFPMSSQEPETQGSNPLPLPLPLPLPPPRPPPAPPVLNQEHESMEISTNNDVEAAVPQPVPLQWSYPVFLPAFVSPFFPYPSWPAYFAGPGPEVSNAHGIFKPVPLPPTTPIAVDELSKLSLGESSGGTRPSFLSPTLPDGSWRQSAFHANPPTTSGRSRINSPTTAVQRTPLLNCASNLERTRVR